MAHAFFTPDNVRQACQAKLDSIALWRTKELRKTVDYHMAQTRFSFKQMKRVPRYKSPEDVITMLKSNKDFFGSAYDSIMRDMGSTWERMTQDLYQLADKAGTPIALTTADVELIGKYLILEGKECVNIAGCAHKLRN